MLKQDLNTYHKEDTIISITTLPFACLGIHDNRLLDHEVLSLLASKALFLVIARSTGMLTGTVRVSTWDPWDSLVNPLSYEVFK